VVISLERGADLHMAQLMPLPLAVSCFRKIQIGFTFLIPAYPGSPRQRAVKRVLVFVNLYCGCTTVVSLLGHIAFLECGDAVSCCTCSLSVDHDNEPYELG